MVSRVHRVYVDTSVFGGCFEDQFESDSSRIFELGRSGRLILVVSDIVLAELAPAPPEVRRLLDEVPRPVLQVRSVDDEVAALRNAYLEAGVLTSRWKDDATHVAVATVARVDALVSWNFKHIVRLDRIRAFNQVNLANGYGIVTILSPTELREYET
ncbi:MAG: hypothetical protein HOP29_02670 [Phycisphaerales bacterium]|nr:hypothetical protein [Phycisphaerales bacterium]